MITIEFNGLAQELGYNSSLLQLIELKNLNPKSLALVLNDQVVPRSRWAQIECQHSDKIDVFSAVAGG
ncbi:sulfur carrier protein ThiS [Shewanella sp. 1_MG-2023]|uniref:Sulfur carrier protein ThiS n=1 Tax=Shewanella electrodiphila TaxID=934143 RepID=A0ABT0KMR1_9GAMM|nr:MULTISPECIES: sulfur carrier protein ThiS [Shewanella]MCC4831997.1 sulfur carrier protein ThiS [Shewanella sp. 10N.7]MCL1045132.1 sulfur carrier protein ThiS [Shewanella electrodiphila]MDO6613363.1 sulfur carrier protein ThiS [Shewanella sp. 7_MG-2023]MDO6773171.1 sulfur carrier protein ThiS [Shewanella sp. 2_MG-2023]MDO6795373.1 sulfur carrier protein ThiS [Shewanella sp. 1_MG-2023]